MHVNTAILFFTRTPAIEKYHKRVHQCDRDNQRLISRLYRHTQSILRRQSLPVIELNENQQHGNSFGERLTNAILYVFDRGFDRLIVVGSDCPLLKVADLRRASRLLDHGQQVLGHTRDGGAYLIGLRKKNFCPRQFRELPWTTAQLGQALEHYLRHAGETSLLPETWDLDDMAGLKSLLGRHFIASVLKIFLNLLKQSVPGGVIYPVRLKAPQCWICFFRGPPARS